jgi:hypothetical protein
MPFDVLNRMTTPAAPEIFLTGRASLRLSVIGGENIESPN